MVLLKFTPDTPWLPWQQNLGQMGYNLTCVRDICKIFASVGGGFGDGPSNAANWILSQPTPIATATKFWTKWTITRLVLEISARFLHLLGGFQRWAIECCQRNYTPTDPRCHVNEIWDKMGYSSAFVRDITKVFASNCGFWGMGC